MELPTIISLITLKLDLIKEDLVGILPSENYITNVGFTPRLCNYDAVNDVVVREGYLQTSSGIDYEKFYEKSKILNSVRYGNYGINNYFDN